MTVTPYPVRGTSFDERLDGLLVEWHEYQRNFSYGGKQGYRHEAAGTGSARSAGFMDWWNGAADDRAEKIRLEMIDEAVRAVPNEPQPWHAALAFHARNLHAGRVIWDSPRLPADREEREVLILEARTLLATELHKRKVQL